jgi:secreted trypsin-like serine protease
MTRRVMLATGLILGGLAALPLDAVARPTSVQIIGCQRTQIEFHPWQVALSVKWPDKIPYLCGGSIIDGKWVLTAAHCFDPSTQPSDVSVKSGQTNIVSTGEWKKIERIVRHEGYDPNTKENDIALVKLVDAPVGQAIPLAEEDIVIPDQNALEVTGWGKTETGALSPTLCETTVPYVTNIQCNTQESYNGAIGSGMLCAGYRGGGTDACGGDSGGPLVRYSQNGSSILVGVVSWGRGCAEAGKYGVYTRVSAYRDWIASAIAANGQ